MLFPPHSKMHLCGSISKGVDRFKFQDSLIGKPFKPLNIIERGTQIRIETSST